MKLFRDKKSVIDDADIDKERLQFLTDGVFAIAMTLLVLEVHVPEIAHAGDSKALWLALVALLPKLLSFAVSFIILGMFWVAHHTEFHFIEKPDNKIMWLNIFYLLFVCLVPFSAALLGEYHGNQAAVVVYGLNLSLLVILLFSIWKAARRNERLKTRAQSHEGINRLVNNVTIFALVAYSIAIAVSFFNLEIPLIIYAITPLPYIFGWAYRLS